MPAAAHRPSDGSRGRWSSVASTRTSSWTKSTFNSWVTTASELGSGKADLVVARPPVRAARGSSRLTSPSVGAASDQASPFGFKLGKRFFQTQAVGSQLVGRGLRL